MLRNGSAFSQPPFSPPWEDWQLDATFLTALSDWEVKNPETTLQRVFQSASYAIDQGKDLVEVIPDTFPAKGLVKAVLQLVKLGATISRAQPELVGFTKDIIEWVDGVKISFANAASGNVTETTWENLARTRDLINEICMWAVLRLEDGRWSLKNARIDKEISDFQARLDHAHKVFHNRSIIVISGGLDAILQKLRALLKSFDRISRALEDVRNTQKEHHKAILEELQNQQEAHDRQKFLQTSLHPKTAEKVGYDQQEKVPCDKDTRIEVLADIRAWVNDISHSSKNFLWLTGDPGCGKSAVTASVARECKDRKILWAQFFINRNNDVTTNPNLYFPTIARQLAEYSGVVERQVFNTLRQKLSLLDNITREQATRLFVETLGAAARTDPKAPVVVVIDGLDETRRNKLEETAIIISTLFDALKDFPNVKVFISSRTEHGIQRPFSKAMQDRRVKNIHLDTNSESSVRDVEIYLRKRFAWIAEKYGYNPNMWPGEERLQALASHASGHFIWAVTATKFLEEQMDEWGFERLDTVMENLGTMEGKQDIKALYGVILHLVYRNSTDSWAFETFRRVVLLNLKKDLHSSHVDLLHFVRRLRTLLVAGTGDINGETILRLHKSFFEYITSENCEDCFRVSLEASRTELACQCLHQITRAYSAVRNMTDTQYFDKFKLGMSQLPSQLEYSLRYCMSYIPERDNKPLRIMVDNPDVNPLRLNAMLCRSFGVDEGAGPLTLRYLANTGQIFTSLDNHDLHWHSNDGRFSPKISVWLGSNKRIVSSAISPLGTTIAVALFYLPSGPQCQSEVQILNTENLVHLYSIPIMDVVRSLTYSIDGKYIAVLTSNSIIKTDVETGIVSHVTIIEEPSVRLRSDATLTFSLDGSLHTIEISDTSPSVLVRSRIDCPTGKVEKLHEAQCRFMDVSRDSTGILTITQKSVYLWDFQSGHLIEIFPSDFDIWCAAISPDKEIVICSDSLGTVFMWNIKGSQSWKKLSDIGSYLGGRYFTRRVEAWRSSSIDHLSFSLSGDFIVATSHGIAHLWDCRSEKKSFLYNYDPELQSGPSRHAKSEVQFFKCPIFSLSGEHLFLFNKDGIVKHVLSESSDYQLKATPLQVEWTLFSPDGRYHMYAVSDGGVWLHDPGTRRTSCLPFPENKVVRIVDATFSRRGSRIAGISTFGVVYIWDTAHHSLLGVSTQLTTVKSISFAMDEETIIISYSSGVKGTALHLSLVNGRLVIRPDRFPTTLKSVKARFFNADTNGYVWSSKTAPNSRTGHVRWFSGPSNDYGIFWALVDNHIVRGGADGTFVVVPVDVGKEQLERKWY
ncbi:hypothetical protein H2248_000080 [Termitomyces sp. 'cryptogamus']|nr:hypothetical protein H2248_000080 [Termitomyces sp. 'cryptogamus']